MKKTEPTAKVTWSALEPTRVDQPGTAPSANRTEPIAKNLDSSLAFPKRVNRGLGLRPAPPVSLPRATPDRKGHDSAENGDAGEKNPEYPQIGHPRRIWGRRQGKA